MLPVYRAIAFDQIIDKGGRTCPWSILVETDAGIKPFVVKMFTPQLIETRDSVTNEVLGNILAKQFDLPVPQAALIEMDEDFRHTINDGRAQMDYDLIDERIKFGTSLIQGNYLFNPAFTKTQAAKMIELDTLFAFDNLIRNRDRNKRKPNLLVKGKSAYLIDHELGFEIEKNTIDDYHNGIWDASYYKYHIFWDYLKRSRNETKLHYFNTFNEYLRTLNLNSLDSYFQQLNEYGYSTVRHKIIKDYLADMKKISSNFVNLLKKII